MRRSADNRTLLVHLVNRTMDWKPAPAADSRPLRATLTLDAKPSAVTLEPGGEKPKWNYEGRKLSIEADVDAIGHHRIIRIAL